MSRRRLLPDRRRRRVPGRRVRQGDFQPWRRRGLGDRRQPAHLVLWIEQPGKSEGRLRYGAAIGRDHLAAEVQRLGDGKAPSLGEGGVEHEVAHLVQPAQRLVGAMLQPSDPAAEQWRALDLGGAVLGFEAGPSHNDQIERKGWIDGKTLPDADEESVVLARLDRADRERKSPLRQVLQRGGSLRLRSRLARREVAAERDHLHDRGGASGARRKGQQLAARRFGDGQHQIGGIEQRHCVPRERLGPHAGRVELRIHHADQVIAGGDDPEAGADTHLPDRP